jgi:guanine deaminase
VLLDLHSTSLIAHRMRAATDIADVLFVQMMMGDERAIRATYVAGRRVHDRDALSAST